MAVAVVLQGCCPRPHRNANVTNVALLARRGATICPHRSRPPLVPARFPCPTTHAAPTAAMATPHSPLAPPPALPRALPGALPRRGTCTAQRRQVA